MSSPYFNTYLYTIISLHPSNMDNDIYKHLKKNLIAKMQGKCYKSYGYISKIYKIEEEFNGELIEEDNSASAFYKIKFSCKICKPLKNTFIICEVQNINKSAVHLSNGPIQVFIFNTGANANQNNFKFDEKRNVLVARSAGSNIGKDVTKGTFAKIKVVNTKIEKDKILVLGTMENVATEKEIEDSIMMREKDTNVFVEYNDYINETPQEQFVHDENVSDSDSESDTGSDE